MAEEIDKKAIEEKAEEYINTHPCFYRQDFIRTYLDGLAEGRKEQEKKDKGFCESFCMKGGKITDLEKENAELNAKLNHTHCVECAREYLKEIGTLKEQIEKMKCCGNCKHFVYVNFCNLHCEDIDGDNGCKEWELPE